jgi:hypothetical protein
MTADNLTTAALVLFSTVTGALISIVPALFLANKAERRERARELWRRDAALCTQLEELAGEISDRLSGWAMRPEDYDPLGGKIAEMALLSGKFPRHPQVQQAIRDLHNTAGRMWTDRNRYDSQQEREQVIAELRERRDQLLAACSDAIGRDAERGRNAKRGGLVRDPPR